MLATLVWCLWILKTCEQTGTWKEDSAKLLYMKQYALAQFFDHKVKASEFSF
jgi:hypothetical protein